MPRSFMGQLSRVFDVTLDRFSEQPPPKSTIVSKNFERQLRKWEKSLRRKAIVKDKHRDTHWDREKALVEKVVGRLGKLIRSLELGNKTTEHLTSRIDQDNSFVAELFIRFAVNAKHRKSIRRIYAERKTQNGARLAHRHGVGIFESQRLARVVLRASMNQKQLNDAKLASMKQLAYGASHEVNNPLANIATRAQVLLRDESDPTRRKLIAMIEQQAMRAHEMIANMMYFAHPPKPNLALCCLAELSTAVAAEMAEHLAERRAKLELVGTNRSLPVLVDKQQIQMALKLLIDNSLEAIGQDGTIVVELESHNHRPKLSVMDTGHGLDESAREHLFDPFYSGREAGRGLGLGLSKVWRIAVLHDIRIQVKCCQPNGTSISLDFPACDEFATEKSAEPHSVTATRSSNPAA